MSQFADDPPAVVPHRAVTRRTVIGRTAAAGLAVAGSVYLSNSSAHAFKGATTLTSATPVASPATGAPTVVLVHGSFADGSSWTGVIAELESAGISVVAPANPSRGLSVDAAYVASFVSQIPGPVLLVGHSYGGAVITNAATSAENVLGLVYIASFIPDEGESILDLANQATDSLLGPALRPSTYPTADPATPGTELSIDRVSFHTVFCADLPAEKAAILAATQRPTADIGFGEPSGVPAWKTLPSWAAVGTEDKVIGVTGSRAMAQRCGATTIEIDSSHVIMISNPQAVADLIRAALGSVS